jgi:hypothetical protein
MHDAGWQRAPHTSSDATTSTMQTYNTWITCQAREFQDFSIPVIELTLVHRGLGRQRDYGPTRMFNSPRAGTGPRRSMCQQDAESLWCWQRHRSRFTRCQHPGHRTYITRKILVLAYGPQHPSDSVQRQDATSASALLSLARAGCYCNDLFSSLATSFRTSDLP